MGNKLYIGNLAAQVTSEDLSALFAGAGQVVSAQVIMDRATRQSKGFGFIEMGNAGEALQAITLYNGHPLHDQALIVNEARPSENQRNNLPAAARPKFREVKHKRRGGGNIHRFH